jgi:hypothetical protein
MENEKLFTPSIEAEATIDAEFLEKWFNGQKWLVKILF